MVKNNEKSTKQGTKKTSNKKEMTKQMQENMKKVKKSGKYVWGILIVVVIISIFSSYWGNKTVENWVMQVVEKTEKVSLNTFLSEYNEGKFKKVELVNDKRLEGFEFIKSGESLSFMTMQKHIEQAIYKKFVSEKPVNTSLKDLWISLTGSTQVISKYEEEWFMSKMFTEIVPLLVMFVLFLVLMKFVLPKGWPMGMLNTNAGKQADPKKVKTKFADVAGLEEVKTELSEIVDYLKNTDKYTKVGARHPKWVLLYGQPWSGKTLLARAVAGEANVPFFSVSWSEFMEMLVGMGAAKVRTLFSKAKQSGKAIIFIDEIDAIGRKRGMWSTWWHQEQEQTLNQILTEMDGFENDTQIIVIAATNRLDILDPALMRAGRFDRKIMVANPTLEERIEIMNYYLKEKKIADDVDKNSLAKRTSGLVGADIENIINEASLKIAKAGREIINEEDMEYALEKVLMGPEKKMKSMREKEKKIIAYHELGHAVTAHLLPNADEVEKISIVRRGHALGATWMIPAEDQYLYSKNKILEETVSLLWGRAAEEFFFGKNEITTGASNDFERASAMIRNMITKYGMDEDMGNICYDLKADDYAVYKPYSERTAENIDKKVQDYTRDCYKKSLKILKENKKKIEEMVEILLEKEYLSKKEFNDLMKN